MNRLMKMLFTAAFVMLLVFAAKPMDAQATADPLTQGTGVFPDGFDPAYYAVKYPDVAAVMGKDPMMLYNHYTLFGKKEKRYKNAQEEMAALAKLTPQAPVPAAAPAAPAAVPGNTYIDVNISTQTLTYMVNGQVALSTPVVTGHGGRSTPIGTYPITSMVPGTRLKGPTWDVWVDRWMRIGNTHCGLHDASWRGAFGGTVYMTNGSHGCVNLPHDVALVLYNMIQVGTVVNIHY